MTTYTLTANTASHPSFERAGVGAGRLVTKRYNAASRTLAQNDIVELIPVKAGEMVLFAVAKVVTPDAASTSADVGDGATADGYVDGVDTSAAGYSLCSLAGAEGFAIPKVYTANDTIDLKAMGAAGLTVGVIEVTAYIIPIPTGF